jgi:hypothetical protein
MSLTVERFDWVHSLRIPWALQAQGLNEEAARFAYQAQILQRAVSRLQKKFGQYLFSLFLDLLAGYGYRPGRSVLWYLIIIFGFALTYHFLGGLSLFPQMPSSSASCHFMVVGFSPVSAVKRTYTIH